MKKGSIFVIAGVILAAVVFYGVRYVRAPIGTQTLQMVTREERFPGEAYIVRDEIVYTAPTTGTLYSYTDEGARVGKNRLIAAVYDGVVEEKTLQELNNLDKKIEQLEEDKAQRELFVTDENSTESQLEKLKDNIIEAAAENDIAQISEYKEYINKINSGEFTYDDNTLEMLKAEKTEIELQIGHTKQDILSQNSGVYSNNVDGYEDILAPESIMDFTLDAYRGLEDPGPAAVQKVVVTQGDQVCKVADNHVWYVMALVDKQYAEPLSEGTAATIRFNQLPGVETPVTIEKIVREEGDEQALIIFKSERYSEGVFSMRTSDIEVVLASYEGFEIPVHSLRVQDGETGVMVQKGQAEVFKKCEVIYTDQQAETVIVQPVTGEQNLLTVGDKVILGEKTELPDTTQQP